MIDRPDSPRLQVRRQVVVPVGLSVSPTGAMIGSWRRSLEYPPAMQHIRHLNGPPSFEIIKNLREAFDQQAEVCGQNYGTSEELLRMLDLLLDRGASLDDVVRFRHICMPPVHFVDDLEAARQADLVRPRVVRTVGSAYFGQVEDNLPCPSPHEVALMAFEWHVKLLDKLIAQRSGGGKPPSGLRLVSAAAAGGAETTVVVVLFVRSLTTVVTADRQQPATKR